MVCMIITFVKINDGQGTILNLNDSLAPVESLAQMSISNSDSDKGEMNHTFLNQPINSEGKDMKTVNDLSTDSENTPMVATHASNISNDNDYLLI